jgi:hypothetical protein
LAKDLPNSRKLSPSWIVQLQRIQTRVLSKVKPAIELLLTRQKKTTNTTLRKNKIRAKEDSTMSIRKGMRTKHSANINKKSTIKNLVTRTTTKMMVRPKLSLVIIVRKTKSPNRKFKQKKKNYKTIRLKDLVKSAKVEVAVKSKNVTTTKMTIK